MNHGLYYFIGSGENQNSYAFVVHVRPVKAVAGLGCYHYVNFVAVLNVSIDSLNSQSSYDTLVFSYSHAKIMWLIIIFLSFTP